MKPLNKLIYKFFFTKYRCYQNYVNKGFLNYLPNDTRKNIFQFIIQRDNRSFTLSKMRMLDHLESLAIIIESMHTNEIPPKSLQGTDLFNMLPYIMEGSDIYHAFKYLKYDIYQKKFKQRSCFFKCYDGNLKKLNLTPSSVFPENHFIRLNCKIKYIHKPERNKTDGTYTQKLTLYDDNTSKTIDAILYDKCVDFDKWTNGRRVNILGYIIHPIFQDDDLPPFQVVSIEYDLNYAEEEKYNLMNNAEDYYCEERPCSEYDEWKSAVIERDGVCQCCGGHKHLEAHHIFSWEDYPNLRIDINNGVTLCKWCHGRYNSYFGHKGTGIGMVKYLNKFNGK